MKIECAPFKKYAISVPINKQRHCVGFTSLTRSFSVDRRPLNKFNISKNTHERTKSNLVHYFHKLIFDFKWRRSNFILFLKYESMLLKRHVLFVMVTLNFTIDRVCFLLHKKFIGKLYICSYNYDRFGNTKEMSWTQKVPVINWN